MFKVVRGRQPAEYTFIGTKCPKYIFVYNFEIHIKWFEVKLKTVDKDRNELKPNGCHDLFVLDYTFVFSL